MEPSELLAYVVRVLEQLAVPYLVTGSTATIAYGEPRFTNDIDIVILKKLEYFREGGSEKHLRDIAGVLKVQGQRVDRQYIVEWAGRLGVLDIWQAVAERTDQTP
jgi:hypothetical protein